MNFKDKGQNNYPAGFSILAALLVLRHHKKPGS